nr:MAG: hypothetical protein EDM05_03900 [Leptolyngbya sp. IPPAS B-1204]
MLLLCNVGRLLQLNLSRMAELPNCQIRNLMVSLRKAALCLQLAVFGILSVRAKSEGFSLEKDAKANDSSEF